MASLINIFWRFLSVMFRVDQNLLHSHESIVHTYTYVCTRTLPTPNMSRLSNICDSCEFEIFAFSLALSSSWLGVFDSRRLGECREQPGMRSPSHSRGQVSLAEHRQKRIGWTRGRSSNSCSSPAQHRQCFVFFLSRSLSTKLGDRR